MPFGQKNKPIISPAKSLERYLSRTEPYKELGLLANDYYSYIDCYLFRQSREGSGLRSFYIAEEKQNTMRLSKAVSGIGLIFIPFYTIFFRYVRSNCLCLPEEICTDYAYSEDYSRGCFFNLKF